jgi:hypothetical protein
MTLNPLPKSLLVIVTSMCLTAGWAQQVNSLGIFTGITVPYTFDAGINKDARYRIKYKIKYAPIGIHYGVDYQGYGFMMDPCITKIGQSFNVINIQGGHVGERNIDLTYFHLPVGVKLHIIDLSFFKVSFVASVGVGFLMKGEESIVHSDAKLKFPIEVTGPYPSAQNDQFELENPGYIVEYDGVIVPRINNESPLSQLLSKDDYRSFQLFGGLGFRSDWDVTEDWRVSFDLRGNIGVLEPRTSEYLDKVKAYEEIYDIYGARKDLFLSFNIGIARTIEIEPEVKERVMRQRRENKSRNPKSHSAPTKKKKRKN